MKVGFFDSGLGGLTVLKEAIENENLNEEIYYLADTKNTPYGVKDEKLVKGLIEDNIKYLVDIGCNPIVIACNTATSLSIEYLRKKYENIIFIGTEPAVKVAADTHMDKKIIVFATSITIRQEKLLKLVEKLDIQDEVELIAADKLVEFAEDANCNNLNKEVEEYLKSLISGYDLTEFSHIVLGCTHFPLFYKNIQNVIDEICPKNNIKIVDGAKGISKNLINKISKLDNKNSTNNSIHIVTTSVSKVFELRSKQILENQKLQFEYKLQ